jgi:hypothetical protein
MSFVAHDADRASFGVKASFDGLHAAAVNGHVMRCDA